MSFNKIVNLCVKHGLLNINVDNSLKIGSIGALLMHNLKTEWFNNIVNNKEHMVFYNSHNFVDTFDFVKNICTSKLPYGIAEKVVIKNDLMRSDLKLINFNEEDPKIKVLDFAQYCINPDFYKCTMFLNPKDSTHFFHQWQRQRRMWWRKFSATPGRYFLTDIQIDESGSQNVEIKANYPWGTQLIETINYQTTPHSQLTEQQLQNRDGKFKIQAHHLTSQISIPTMYLNTICDAYEALILDNKERISFRFHRKLAPYKISFSIGTNASDEEELYELAMYLCKKLRINNISSLLLPSAAKFTLENQFDVYDRMGIPYTIILNETTLKNGVAALRSRDTTLKEQVHVSELPSYVELLFKNY